MIEFNNVSFSYNTVLKIDNEKDEKRIWSLKNINLSVKKGEVILLTGASGCGKTTLLRLINGLIPEYHSGTLEGTVLINGKNSLDLSLLERATIVGTIFQDPRAQFFSVDTTNELAFGLENQGMPEDEIYRRIDQTVECFSIENLMDRNIFELSGGEKQKIACASLGVENSQIIVMDEPSSNLDMVSVEKLRDIISIWKEQRKTIIIFEHRINYIWDLIDCMYVMKAGKIIFDFPIEKIRLLDDKKLAYMDLRSCILENPMEIVLKNQNADWSEMLILKKISMKRGKEKIFDIKEMKIPIGRITAIVGENGKGKTTLLRCLAGLEKSCKGDIIFKGKSYKPKDMRRLSYLVMQDVNHQLFTESVLEEVLISDKREDRDKDIEILKELNLEGLENRHPMSLSGGQRQRVAVACAIASDRELLLFDETTSGLDYKNMDESARRFENLCKKGKTVLIATHDSELIRACCDYIIRL